MTPSLEQMQYVSTFYKDPYSICELYDDKGKKYKVCKICDETVRKNIISTLMKNKLSFGTYGEQLYLVFPYRKGIDLLTWRQQPHSMLERISLCKKIVFHFISLPYDDCILALCLDANTIEIINDDIDFFAHPNFSIFIHQAKKASFVQRMAQICFEILEEDHSIHIQNFLKNPKSFQLISHKLIWKRYRTMDQIMVDLTLLQQDYQNRYRRKKGLWRYGVIIMTLVGVLILLLFFFLQWRASNAQLYEGIPKIGNEQLSP